MTNEVIAAMTQDLLTAFRDCRELVTSRAGKVTHVSKQDGSPVTETDVEIEDRVKAVMGAKYPDMPIFGEEGGYDHALPQTCWLIDPIDGTQSFIDNVPAFTAMAVLVDRDEAIAALIYNYSNDDVYTASRGHGTFKNGSPVDLRKVALPSIVLCKQRFFEPLDAILAPVGAHCETGLSGAGYNFTQVLDGKVAARCNLLGFGYPHDYAPGALMIREAGGVILPIAEESYHFTTKSFIACHPELEDVLRPRLAEIRQLEIDLA